ncbi:MAG: hypothetical protein K2U26_12605 [Cyclobacteriaceae bacterium]|nr:hypothetical protein [Cyclobacteriaceae bacterium]
MKVAEKIEKRILKMPEGTTFKYQQFDIAPNEYTAATKAIERLIRRGIINRASTGVFYKPKQTAFGSLKPKEEELLKPYLFENNKRIAYITGTALYNKMGLTTQVPRNIQVASRSKRITIKVGSMQVRSIKSYVDVTDDNYPILELLDVLRDFKKIPDSDNSQTIRFLIKSMKDLTEKQKSELIKIALKYPPRVRALTGALLTEVKSKQSLSELKKSINPLSTFEFGITQKQLPNIQDWNIC